MKTLVALLLLLLFLATPLRGQNSASYALEFDVFDSGGSGPFLSTSVSHRAHSIIGQAAQLHTSQSSGYILSSGAECMFCDLFMSTGIDPSTIPSVMRLYQNYPNPFKPVTTIRFVLEQRATIELAVFTLLGEKLGTLVKGHREAGEHFVDFDAADLNSGIYVYRLSTEYGALSRTMVVLR